MKIRLYNEEMNEFPESNKSIFDEEWLRILETQIKLKGSENIMLFDLNERKQIRIIINQEQLNKIRKQLKEKKEEIKI